MSKEHLGAMVDIETLSTHPNAIIVSIGGCKYNLETLETYDDFYITIDPKDSKEYGLHVEQATVNWWRSQDPEIMKQWRENGVPLKEAMDKFLNWYDPELAFTCFGLSFDEPIIKSNLIAVGKDVSWKYYKSRCLRTLCEVEGIKVKRSSGHHNALQDCKDQCEALFTIFKK